MIKEIIAYILLLFGVAVAIIGTVYYLRMYKAMNGNQLHKPKLDDENSTNSDEKIQI